MNITNAISNAAKKVSSGSKKASVGSKKDYSQFFKEAADKGITYRNPEASSSASENQLQPTQRRSGQTLLSVNDVENGVQGLMDSINLLGSSVESAANSASKAKDYKQPEGVGSAAFSQNGTVGVDELGQLGRSLSDGQNPSWVSTAGVDPYSSDVQGASGLTQDDLDQLETDVNSLTGVLSKAKDYKQPENKDNPDLANSEALYSGSSATVDFNVDDISSEVGKPEFEQKVDEYGVESPMLALDDLNHLGLSEEEEDLVLSSLDSSHGYPAVLDMSADERNQLGEEEWFKLYSISDRLLANPEVNPFVDYEKGNDNVSGKYSSSDSLWYDGAEQLYDENGDPINTRYDQDMTGRSVHASGDKVSKRQYYLPDSAYDSPSNLIGNQVLNGGDRGWLANYQEDPILGEDAVNNSNNFREAVYGLQNNFLNRQADATENAEYTYHLDGYGDYTDSQLDEMNDKFYGGAVEWLAIGGEPVMTASDWENGGADSVRIVGDDQYTMDGYDGVFTSEQVSSVFLPVADGQEATVEAPDYITLDDGTVITYDQYFGNDEMGERGLLNALSDAVDAGDYEQSNDLGIFGVNKAEPAQFGDEDFKIEEDLAPLTIDLFRQSVPYMITPLMALQVLSMMQDMGRGIDTSSYDSKTGTFAAPTERELYDEEVDIPIISNLTDAFGGKADGSDRVKFDPNYIGWDTNDANALANLSQYLIEPIMGIGGSKIGAGAMKALGSAVGEDAAKALGNAGAKAAASHPVASKVGKVVKQAGEEGLEEVITDYISDVALGADAGKEAIYNNQGTRTGYEDISEEERQDNMFNQKLTDFLMGAYMGGLMSGVKEAGSGIMDKAKQRKYGIYKNNQAKTPELTQEQIDDLERLSIEYGESE